MTPWQHIVSAAIVGTDRLSALPSLPPLLAKLPPQEKEPTLLSAVAVLSLRRRAGWLPEEIAADSVEAPCEPEDRPPISRNAARQLKALLAGEHPILLPEWLRTVDRAGRLVPPELLPRLLAHAKPNRKLESSLTNVIGKRGAWLIEHNPDWQHLDIHVDAALWEIGDMRQRVACLAAKRSEAPAVARAMLEAVISKESATVRAEFIEALATGLSLDDEPFLEQSLDDKSKEVRKAAASLLGRLPSSRWVGRMTARGQTALVYQPGGFLRGAKLEVALPESLDNAMKRDGIDPAPYTSRKQLGERAAIFMLIIGGIPPSYWEQISGIGPEAILKLAKDHEWEQPLVSGWAMAAVRFGNAAWAAAILGGETPWSQLLVPVAEVATVVTHSDRESFILHAIGGTRGIFVSTTPEQNEATLSMLRPILDTFDELPDRLAAGILPLFRRNFSIDKPSWPCLSLLQELAPRISLSACTGWNEALAQITEANPHYKSIQKTAELLSFRIEMHRAIQEADL